jgi:hypothetical protein
MKKKIYIAGKVTGENKEDCIAKFAQAKSTLEARGFEAINPIEVVGDWNTPWDKAMKLCVAKLTECDGILLLEDWVTSKGARIEFDIATQLNIPNFRGSFFGFEKLSDYKWNN